MQITYRDEIGLVTVDVNMADTAGVGFDGQIAGNITYFYGLCPKCTSREKKTEKNQ